MAGVTAKIGWLIRLTIEVGQRFGVNILPNHYYTEFPDIRFLKRETYWRKPWSMVGVRGAEPTEAGGGVDQQLSRLRDWCEPFRADLETNTIHQRAIDRNGEGGFGRTEADVLHCFVRSQRPKKVIQVGCGVSTAVVQNAADAAGCKVEIVCVEPYPTSYLQSEHDAGRIRLVREMAQKVALNELTSLAPGDLFFIDSTHTVRLGSEVPRLILEALPRLPVGAFVHFHDIHFPYDFPPGSLDKELFFQRESAMLHAFLCMNPSYRIAASLAMLHHAAADRLRGFIPHYAPAELRDGLLVKAGERPSSMYLERT